jgi:hypothetical protein
LFHKAGLLTESKAFLKSIKAHSSKLKFPSHCQDHIYHLYSYTKEVLGSKIILNSLQTIGNIEPGKILRYSFKKISIGDADLLFFLKYFKTD